MIGNLMAMQSNEINTRWCPVCPLCGGPGNPLYKGLTDRIFSAPGVWDIRKCNSPECGCLWLDPVPVDADLPKLYTGYYTHQATSPRSDRVFARVRMAYLHARFGYETLSDSRLDNLLGLLVHANPVWRDSLDASVFYLDAKPGGRLLEVGCGSGAVLQSMQKKGWQVSGLDFDQAAVDNAKAKGLEVYHGQLADQAFADETFDAVVMSHVVEHLPSPFEVLAECRRILKRDGVLVLLTPNADSMGHRHFRQNWRGLEPPRHLQIFTLRSLAEIAARAGFSTIGTSSSMNGFVYQRLASEELALGERHVMGRPVALVRRLRAHLKAFVLGWWKLLSRGQGEEAVLVCRK